jgi:thiol-disulfide isomerase/thioredoxin
VAVAAAVAAVAVFVAVAATGSRDDGGLVVGAVTATGTALPPYAGTLPDPAVGATAPVVAGVNFAGEPVTIGATGTPQILVFLAHWCGICQREVPALVAWAEGGGDTAGVDVVGVATGNDRAKGNWPPGAWLAEEGWPYQTLVDDATNRAGAAYGLAGYPYFVAVGADGTILARVAGELSADAFAQLVVAARAGTPVVPTSGDATPAG